MADLFSQDDFGEGLQAPQGQQPAVEVDPAAAFLAQQEDEIAGLESEAYGNSFGTLDDQPPQNDYSGTNGYAEDFLQDNSQQNLVSGDDLFSAPANYENDYQGDVNAVQNGGDDLTEMDPSQAYAAIAEADARIQQLRSEPEKIIQWREEHNRMLQEKDAEEEMKKREWLDTAKKELEDWERNRLEQLEKTKANNRTAEQEFINERDENKPGSEWERVAKLCDFNPKSSKSVKDVSRMRSSLLQLKQHNLSRPMKVE